MEQLSQQTEQWELEHLRASGQFCLAGGLMILCIVFDSGEAQPVTNFVSPILFLLPPILIYMVFTLGKYLHLSRRVSGRAIWFGTYNCESVNNLSRNAYKQLALAMIFMLSFLVGVDIQDPSLSGLLDGQLSTLMMLQLALVCLYFGASVVWQASHPAL